MIIGAPYSKRIIEILRILRVAIERLLWDVTVRARLSLGEGRRKRKGLGAGMAKIARCAA